MYGTGYKEATDGKYYVTETGDCLHVDPNCQYPYHYSRIVWLDKTNTLSYRVRRQGKSGEVMRAPNGIIITSLCWICAVDHQEQRDLPSIKTTLRNSA